MTDLSPREIVSELDRHIVAQSDAKRAVAIALRGRWRRQRVDEDLRDEITPKNILMIGPTGVGKTEISRRLAKLAKAPFIKVEATKFTEVGYVGRDVEQIIRDLVEAALVMIRETRREDVRAAAEVNAEARILDVLVGESAGESTRAKFREKLIRGELDDKEVEIEMDDSPSMPSFDIPGQPGASMGMIDLSSLLSKGMRPRRKVKMKIADAYEPLLAEESDKLLDEDGIKRDALKLAEQNGIVFLDEIDKITSRSENGTSASVSREGVQRDLLPLIEGTTVSTKYGPIKTDHILFIASGAFHVARPSDLLPELQGRLPIRVELRALTEEDFVRILTEPEASLITQYIALMKTEEVELEFTEDAIAQLAKLSAEINSTIENIGARRLHTVMERLLDDISFSASDKSGEKLVIDADYVNEHVGGLLKSTDLSKFIL